MLNNPFFLTKIFPSGKIRKMLKKNNQPNKTTKAVLIYAAEYTFFLKTLF